MEAIGIDLGRIEPATFAQEAHVSAPDVAGAACGLRLSATLTLNAAACPFSKTALVDDIVRRLPAASASAVVEPVFHQRKPSAKAESAHNRHALLRSLTLHNSDGQ